MTEISSQGQFSRRQFGRTFGAALAAAVVSPRLIQEVAGGHGDAHMPPDAIFINFNENPYGPSDRAIEAITRSEVVAGRYPDGIYARLTQVIADFHHMNSDNVALGCGSTEILRACDDAFLSSGKNFVIAEPTFEAVTHYAVACKADAVKIPLTSDFRHDLPKIAAACTGATGLVYICNPNNPTATIVTRDELTDFMNRVPASTHVLVDEAYFHFVEDPRYSSVIDWTVKYPNLIVARTFSKVYGMAGMRLGYAIAPKETIAALRRELTEQNGNAAVLPAAIASLNDPDVVPVNKKRLNETRNWVTSELSKDGHRVMPSEANFFMVEVGGDVSPVIEAFRQRKIMLGRKFPSLGNWLRVSVGKPEEMQKFLAVFREIIPAASKSAA
ncbi:MAG TPA: aminotransferase class I/II-fold pyridoxal phosphate-dependent enzyme [Candidatus Acidoferrales bacterium]|nr:aminotransferase class I/II-fold pyridoxal phosphate-dependent enzyme [Candidatus Acidoferrales bacterium]